MRILAALIFASALMFAQTTPSQAPSANAPASTRGTKGAPTTPDRANAQTTAPADIKEVRRNLEALKTAVSKMDEGPAHDAAEQNVKFLESLVSYLEHERSGPAMGTDSTPRARTRRPITSAPTGVAGDNPK